MQTSTSETYLFLKPAQKKHHEERSFKLPGFNYMYQSATFYGVLIFLQGKLLCKNILPPLSTGVYSKGKECSLVGTKVFTLRLDPFYEKAQYAGKQMGSHKSCLSSTKNVGNLSSISVHHSYTYWSATF